MKVLLLLLLIALCAALETNDGRYYPQPFCDQNSDIKSEYRTALYNFAIPLFRKVAERAKFHFVFSPFTVWKSLAAMAEGADPSVQRQFFEYLKLPQDLCTRQRYYDMMNQRIVQGNDMKIDNTRTLVVDENVSINRNWLEFVFKNSLLEVSSAPIRNHPMLAANYMRQIMSSPLPRLNLDGNSVILDSVEYNGIWTNAFSDAIIRRAPFYDPLGHQIGTVDLMTMKKRAKMAYFESMGMKLIELPVGTNGRYVVLVGYLLSGDKDMMAALESFDTVEVLATLNKLKMSKMPIEIAIPRFTLTSDIDVKTVLEEMGLSNLWVDPAATRYITEPAALPSTYAQRVILTFDHHGLTPYTEPSYDAWSNDTGLDPILGKEFIANRPFLFAVLDAETYSCVLSASYTQPMYGF